ncbi:hypothetical protein [Lentzea cavernae]|uniref:Uncharacterized protein n=1 Tax=Lentzea cavernae TaxID=2020703 RepID=A0ABQ3MSJ1_9PSEU|nr:hypothetical protein [Lentzea cavernae]GHH57535.1 hypothetical protein GCM10017774_77190 [Lentzea cavernae]
MTAPDPLECLALRAGHDQRLCTALESEHCETCQLCPGHCACHQLADHLPKGTRVRVTFDAVVLGPPNVKPDQYALVVLPGTNLDSGLLMDRFRVPLDAITALDPKENP